MPKNIVPKSLCRVISGFTSDVCSRSLEVLAPTACTWVLLQVDPKSTFKGQECPDTEDAVLTQKESQFWFWAGTHKLDSWTPSR